MSSHVLLGSVVLTSFIVLTGCGATPAPVHTTGASSLAPSEQLAATVAAFDGKWSLDAKVTPPGEAPFSAKLDVDCQKVTGERSVRCTYLMHIPGQPDGGGAMLVGYDAFAGKVHFMMMNSDDEIHDHACTWKDRNNLDCGVYEGSSGGKKVSEELHLTSSPGNLGFRSSCKFADGSVLQFEASGGHRSGS